jgi:MGT family glycosyltransferase
MSRFLVVVPPFTGHIMPMIGVASELTTRGHDVTWVGDATRLPPDWPSYDTGEAPLPPRPADLRGFAALKYLWEEVLAPLADWMSPAVTQAIRETRPDVVIADQQALAGALVAERGGIRWATSATTSAELTDPLAALPQVRDWLTAQLAALRARIGDPTAVHDPRFSPHLVLAFTTKALAADSTIPATFVGPITHEPAESDFPWPELDSSRKAVLVTMGTANTDASAGFLRACASALGSRDDLQPVFADPGNALADVDGIIRRPWLPQQALLPHVSAVICHAGHNTVCETLSRGIPLVVAPIRDDQPVIAEQVAATGAGIRLRFAHARAPHIAGAVDRVLTDPAFTRSARRIAESFSGAGGAPAAADALEKLTS